MGNSNRRKNGRKLKKKGRVEGQTIEQSKNNNKIKEKREKSTKRKPHERSRYINIITNGTENPD